MTLYTSMEEGICNSFNSSSWYDIDNLVQRNGEVELIYRSVEYSFQHHMIAKLVIGLLIKRFADKQFWLLHKIFCCT